MTRLTHIRERITLSIFDTIAFEGGFHGKRFGSLFHVADPKHTNIPLPGMLASDQTATIERIVLEARTPVRENLGVLRTDLQLSLLLGNKPFALLPPLLDKITDDGVARYDLFTDVRVVDAEELELQKMLQDEADKGDEASRRWLETRTGEDSSPRGYHVPARQNIGVNYVATDRAVEILSHPETLARVWIIGQLIRDVA